MIEVNLSTIVIGRLRRHTRIRSTKLAVPIIGTQAPPTPGTRYTPTVTDERLAELERRLQRVEYERAIERLIASYGPLVDAGEADSAAQLWATDGTYDVEGWPMRSREDVAAMVRSDEHQGL